LKLRRKEIALAACLVLSSTVTFAAGVREAAIGLEFPERLGAMALKGRMQFPQPADGASITYEAQDVRGAVYVYNAGLKEVPTGVGSPVIHRHFQQTAAALQRAGKEGPADTSVRPIKGSTISAFPGCGPQFLWRSDAIEMRGQSVVSRTYLTGYNNHFVKLRVTHPRNDDKAAEQFVQDVRKLLGRCG
jgi:hypothetical protein